MTTLRSAVQEYPTLRRSLGFKLHEAGKGLLAFVTFMEQHRAAHITTPLALPWAQHPANAQPTHRAQRRDMHWMNQAKRELQLRI